MFSHARREFIDLSGTNQVAWIRPRPWRLQLKDHLQTGRFGKTPKLFARIGIIGIVDDRMQQQGAR
jgi:hypothetical protein